MLESAEQRQGTAHNAYSNFLGEGAPLWVGMRLRIAIRPLNRHCAASVQIAFVEVRRASKWPKIKRRTHDSLSKVLLMYWSG